jgi:dihydrofolate synthase / folylpolyglutamate synthase
MNYQQTLDYLFQRLPMFSRIGAAAYKADLHNTIALCDSLNNPQRKFKTIHVAGTNGKGSVSHMLAAILQTAGYKTGLYTSPHLYDFRERIKVNGEMVAESFIVDFTERIQPMIDKVEPSFFEITVAMAFDYFAQEQVEVAVIETGLGGRLDSTNVITPELSVITNIGWDHMNLLGDSLEKIAFEKAGIIKEIIPVVIGEWLPETKPVFEKTAAEKHAPLHWAASQRQVMDWQWKHHHLLLDIAEQHKTDHQHYELDLPGIYQAKNILTVLEACSVLEESGWNINHAIIHDALKQVKKLTGLHGRWEILRSSPLLVLDVAHNADGVQQLLQQVEVTDHRQLYIVIGMVKDKDTGKVLDLLPKQAYYYFTQAHIPRALPVDELAAKAKAAGLTGESSPDVNAAVKAVLAKAKSGDMIVVCGSVFLVGEVDKSLVS